MPPSRRSPDVVFHAPIVDRTARERLLGQRGCVVWLTGYSGAGKSTVANAVDLRLLGLGRAAYLLDGDNLRHGLNADLGFSPEDRAENVRRLGEVAALMADAGLIVLVAAVSPYRADREAARDRVGADRFVEVHVATDLAVCRARDPKGLYRRAARGEIAGLTGVDAPYEPPAAPELRLAADADPPEALAETVVAYLADRGFLRAPA